ncbi:hypothetical protein ARSEF4850_003611 [Beauveria asiatica]
MQPRQSNALQSRRTQPTQSQQRGPHHFWPRSKPALGNGGPYGPPHTQPYQASGDEPAAAALQQGARTSNFRVGHGAGAGPLPMADAVLGAAPPSEASPEDMMNTMNQLKCMIERMREKRPEEGQSLSYLPSECQDGASADARYEDHSQEIEHLRTEVENRKKEVDTVRQQLESVKRDLRQLEEANTHLQKMTTESLESLRDQLSLLLNTFPPPGDDPFAYPPLPSA